MTAGGVKAAPEDRRLVILHIKASRLAARCASLSRFAPHGEKLLASPPAPVMPQETTRGCGRDNIRPKLKYAEQGRAAAAGPCE